MSDKSEKAETNERLDQHEINMHMKQKAKERVWIRESCESLRSETGRRKRMIQQVKDWMIKGKMRSDADAQIVVDERE